MTATHDNSSFRTKCSLGTSDANSKEIGNFIQADWSPTELDAGDSVSLYALLKHHKVPLTESHDFPSVFLAGYYPSFQINGLGSIIRWCVVKFKMVSFALCSILFTTKSDFVTCHLCKWHAEEK